MWPLLFLHLLTPIGIVRSQPGANHGSHHKEPPGKARSLVDQDLNTDEILKSEDEEELEVDPGYPTDRIEMAVAKAPKEVTDWLRKEVSQVNQVNQESQVSQVNQCSQVTDWLKKEVNQVRKRRSSSEPTGNEFQRRICPLRINHILPRAARRSTDPDDFTFYHPVNLRDYVQRVTTALCDRNMSTESVLDEEEHRCRQLYVNIPLVAVVIGSTDLVLRFFQFPHGCSCYLKANQIYD